MKRNLSTTTTDAEQQQENFTELPKRNKTMKNDHSSFVFNLSKLPSDVVLHSILPHYILNLDRYAFLYNKHKYDLCLLFMGKFHNHPSQIHLIFKNVSITSYKAVGRNGEVFNFFEKGILDRVLPSKLQSISFLSNFFTQGTSVSTLPSIIMESAMFLKHLNLTYQTTFKDVEQICSLKLLEHLRLSNSSIPLQEIVQILKSNAKLRCLEYCFPHPPPNEIIDSQILLSAFQERSSTLERLSLNGISGLTDSIVSKLLEILPNLKVLSVQHSPHLTNQAFSNIEQNGKNLTFLDISGCENITCPFKIVQAPNLRTIVMEECDLTSKDVSIKNISCSACITDLSLESCVIKDEVFETIFSKFPSLTSLNLTNTRFVEERNIETFFKNIQNLSDLKELNLTNCQFVSDALFSNIVKKDLKMLRVGGCTRLSDSCIPHLLKFEKLTELDIGKTKISSEGVQSLLDHFKNTNTMLDYLSIHQLNLKDSDILNIQGWSQIERLNLSKNRISDSGFKSLLKYSNLMFLNVSDNLITDSGIDNDLFTNKTLTGLILVANRKITNKKRSQIVMKCTHIFDLHL
ncbi:hypothetical protein FDP41_005821 [Naegleria fowleri]|uniref:F-box domain-containing protein n=1 Tax=Naegleria fowleri TaxID=5763 RepID=A0A6A5BLM6_NAEFO|nr:uncharacterized protein FDP41_005821 [Naegleria fowleri]KAF0975068.1 hypothetical protein FDP41_005821 [Naegleria fowleri]CAG4708552.1 unnamed protein product [Naegleria fowleri]